MCRTSKQQCEKQHDTSHTTTSWFVFSLNCADGIDLHADEGSRAAWLALCELVVGSDDARVRECEFVEILVDTRATEHVCGPH